MSMTDSMDWPQTVNFVKDDLLVTINSDRELSDWFATELRLWESLVPGSHRSQELNNNIQVLMALGRSKSPQYLANMAQTYVPVQGRLGKFAERIMDIGIRDAFFSEIVQSGSTYRDGKDTPTRAMGRTLSQVYQSVAAIVPTSNDTGSLTANLREQLVQAEALEKRFEESITQSKKQWEELLAGYEAKLHLGKAEQFWAARADAQNKIVTWSRRWWSGWVAVAVAAVAIAFWANFSFQLSQPDVAGKIAEIVERLLAFGTILAIATWWLRQKLRELRTHEAFAEDAAERATMIRTYAALKGSGLGDGALEAVLAAIYRPSPANLGDESGPIFWHETFARVVAEMVARGKSGG
ncbi:MAG TPA: DUF6161 domain-containing protein [Rhizomicrobium sp.]|nr:DUF6161 domain-containing protein [Rhizomicrobium sp.]